VGARLLAARWVTGVAGVALVLVATYATVLGVRSGPRMLMAVDAREDGEARGVDVTLGARGPLPSVRAGVDGEVDVVVPRALIPARGVVAVLARGREAGGVVVGIGSTPVVVGVACVAIGGCTGESLGMAGRAVETAVGAGEREGGLVVVDIRRRCPGVLGMARFTTGGETCGGVVGIGRALVVVAVACVAIGGRAREPLGVTGRAVEGDVGTPQGEPGGVVIEARGRPPRVLGMAGFAHGGEACGGVVGVGRALVVVPVA